MMYLKGQIELVSDTHCITGENPLWHAAERALYWCDVPRGQLLRYDPELGSTEIVREKSGDIGGFTIEVDHSLLLFLTGGRVVRWKDGRETVLLDGIARERSSRFNDVIADSHGRVFCGTMRTQSQMGVLYRLHADLRPEIVCNNVGCSNGMGFSGDGTRFYYVDSFAGTVSVFDYTPASGKIGNRRTFAQFEKGRGVPDGMTVDAEDYLWVAFWGGSRVARFDPSGREVASFALPAHKVASLTFGGDDYSTLYITTAGGEARPENGAGAGGLFSLRTDTVGRPEFHSRVLRG